MAQNDNYEDLGNAVTDGLLKETTRALTKVEKENHWEDKRTIRKNMTRIGSIESVDPISEHESGNSDEGKKHNSFRKMLSKGNSGTQSTSQIIKNNSSHSTSQRQNRMSYIELGQDKAPSGSSSSARSAKKQSKDPVGETPLETSYIESPERRDSPDRHLPPKGYR